MYIRYGDDRQGQYTKYAETYHHPAWHSPIFLGAESPKVAPISHEHEDDDGWCVANITRLAPGRLEDNCNAPTTGNTDIMTKMTMTPVTIELLDA